jgi:hypothetical protein
VFRHLRGRQNKSDKQNSYKHRKNEEKKQEHHLCHSLIRRVPPDDPISAKSSLIRALSGVFQLVPDIEVLLQQANLEAKCSLLKVLAHIFLPTSKPSRRRGTNFDREFVTKYRATAVVYPRMISFAAAPSSTTRALTIAPSPKSLAAVLWL